MPSSDVASAPPFAPPETTVLQDDYVRPPIVALERKSDRGSVWRFRIVMTVLVLLMIAVIVFIAHAIVSNGEGSPNVGTGGLAPLSVRR